MAKMDYNAINFKNKDVDKFSGKFGNGNTEKEPIVTTTSDVKNRKNLLGQDVKVTKTNTRTDYGNKMIDTETKNKEVSVSPKRTVVQEKNWDENDFNKAPLHYSSLKNKVAKQYIESKYGANEAEDKDRMIKEKNSQKVTTYGGNKKNILGKEKPGTTVEKESSTKRGSLNNQRVAKLKEVVRSFGSVGAGAVLYDKLQRKKK
jgi:hypothetical protein